jgi:pantetheine-phosphate adenylyltransferase
MKKVVIGGTFDLLHKGHHELIKKALEEGDLYIGLTSDEMAQEMKKRQVQEYQKRKEILEEYLSSLGKNAEIREIRDLYGFSAEEDLDLIVVSPETEKNALLINEKRNGIGKESLEIVKIDFVLADDNKPISSTRIIAGEIDQEGRIC